MKCIKCGYEPTTEEMAKEIKRIETEITKHLSDALRLGVEVDFTKMILGCKTIIDGLQIMDASISKMRDEVSK
jgi:hypothetical protein